MIKLFICAPHINQAAKIATEKIKEIYDIWPLLQREVIGIGDQPGNFGKDYVKLTFKNGSIFDVVGAVDSARGGRRQAGLVDEIRDHDPDDINQIVLPWDIKEGAYRGNSILIQMVNLRKKGVYLKQIC